MASIKFYKRATLPEVTTSNDGGIYFIKAATDGAIPVLYVCSGGSLIPYANYVTALSQMTDDTSHRLVTDTEKSTWNAKQSALSTTQLAAVNSGITSTKVSNYDSHLSNTTVHITDSERSAWNAKWNAVDASTSAKGIMKVGTGLSASSGTVSVAYGTTSTTACVGNDSRLSDARTPVAHNQASSTINAMTSYSIATSSSAIATTDTLNAAIGKLEYKADKGISDAASAATAASGAQSTADTAVANAATAQSTANSAKTTAEAALPSASFTAANIKSTLGTTAVNRATADADGNTITSTYATKTELSTESSARSTGDSNTLSSAKSYTDDKIAALPTPIQFKGTVGSGGTIEWSALPTAATANNGWTYKVITAHSTAPVCKVGDMIISNGSEWIVIPSGDEPSGTVTSVGLSVPTGLSVSNTPITSSGTIAVSLTSGYTIPTTAKIGEIATNKSTMDSHIASTSNPHSVTKSQVGLGNVTNNAQVKGLSSGTTSGHFVTWGADGYTVADSGKTASSFDASGAASTAKSEVVAIIGGSYSSTSTVDSAISAVRTTANAALPSASFTAANIKSTLGTTAVNRATADADGNTISSTYELKSTNHVNTFGSKTGDITLNSGSTTTGAVNFAMSSNKLTASVADCASASSLSSLSTSVSNLTSRVAALEEWAEWE